MCGRFFRHSPRDELAAAFKAQLGASSSEPGYNIAPGQPVLAVRFNPKTGVRTLDDLQWGLIPHFAKDPKVAYKLINARAEGIDTTPSYRTAFEKRRCLIVADGFFEWKARGKKKQPYAIAREDGKPFALAGIWENWKDPASGQWLRSCAIVTSDSNALVAQIHDRMPVILEPADYPRWLGEEPAPPTELKGMLKPYAGELVMWPVSPRMNRPGEIEGPAVLEPVAEAPDVPESGRMQRARPRSGDDDDGET